MKDIGSSAVMCLCSFCCWLFSTWGAVAGRIACACPKLLFVCRGLRSAETVNERSCERDTKGAAGRVHGLLRTTEKGARADRKSTRLNSSHLGISYAVFCLKK